MSSIGEQKCHRPISETQRTNCTRFGVFQKAKRCIDPLHTHRLDCIQSVKMGQRASRAVRQKGEAHEEQRMEVIPVSNAVNQLDMD